MVKQCSSGGLAVGAGNTYQIEFRGWIAVKIGCSQSRCLSAVGQFYICSLSVRVFSLLIDYCRCPGLYCAADIVMSVTLTSDCRYKERAYAAFTGVKCDIAYLGGYATAYVEDFKSFKYPIQFHVFRPGKVLLFCLCSSCQERVPVLLHCRVPKKRLYNLCFQGC